MEDIDFVVTWVDSNDVKWQEKYNKYAPEKKTIYNDATRYEDYGTFKYWFRSVEKYAPWVHKIFVITDDQAPEWLDANNPKIELVNHKDYIDPQYLPTFSSDVIELNIPNIPNLSEQFVLFNDDFYLNDFVKPEDFFINGVPVDLGTFQPIIPTTNFTHTILNDLLVINRNFSYRKILKQNFSKYFTLKYGVRRLLSAATTLPYQRIIGFFDGHVATPYLKSNFKKALELAPDELEKTCLAKFRTESNINHWLVRYYQFCLGNFIPQSPSFGAFYELESYNQFLNDFKNNHHKILCINDGGYQGKENQIGMSKLQEFFEDTFVNKSVFEK